MNTGANERWCDAGLGVNETVTELGEDASRLSDDRNLSDELDAAVSV